MLQDNEIRAEEIADEWAIRSEFWNSEIAKLKLKRRRRERNSSPLILCGHGVSLRIENGALVIRDGFTHYPQQQVAYRYFRGDLSLPPRIVLLDGSGTLSFDVLSWLAEQGVALARVKWTEKGQLQQKLREALLDELFNDQLHAYGYRIAPSRSRAPVWIAADLFDSASVNWKREEIFARGFTYSEIRIIDPAAIGVWQKPSPGPKGSGEAICDAIDALKKRGVDLGKMPRKSACDLIRDEIGGDHSKGSGLSDQNLAKYIRKKFPSRRIKFQ